MKILATGGAGYIGTHTIVELQNAGHDVVVIDNLSNSSEVALDRVYKLTGKKVKFYNEDICNKTALNNIFTKNSVDCCIHFAGLKSVSESVEKPLHYYNTNISGALTLLEVMQKYNCKNIIFSSSATVYGNPDKMPATEDTPKGICTNPYGWSKSMVEQILSDLYISDKEWNIVVLRYFNPVGAHKSGLIGEDPNGIPNNLMPYISQVAVGKRDQLQVFGNDYNTEDGTGERDYIHVVDLAHAHLKSLSQIESKSGFKIYNIATGNKCSVLNLVESFSRINNIEIPYTIAPRRKGDVAMMYAAADKALEEINWQAQYNIDDMCKDTYNWQTKNPNGYRKND